VRVWPALLILPLSLQTGKSSDFEVWSEIDFSAQLNARWSVFFPVVARDGASLPNPQLAGAGALASWRWTERVDLTGGYLLVSLPHAGPGFTVQAPLAAVTIFQKIGRFTLSDRNRAERLKGVPGDPFRYRNRFVVEVPTGSEAWRLFAADEVFYEFTSSAWKQNRFQVGAARTLTSKTGLELHFLERTLRQANPGSTHALGLALDVRFR
jgi:hypothetical protein